MYINLKTTLSALALSLLTFGSSAAETVTVSFVLANDTYQMDESKGRGGFPRLAGFLKQQRAEQPNTLFVHAGDLLSPSLFSGIDQGAHMVRFLNLLKTDVFTPGNHEYDFGPDVAAQRLAESDFPWLAANVRQADGSPVPGMHDSKMFEIDGVKIGVFGLVEDYTSQLSSPGDNLVFANSLETAAVQADALREQGAEFVVAVNHNVRSIGQSLVDQGVADLILNGHNHDLWLFYNGRSAAVESAYDAQYIVAVDINFEIEEEDGKREVDWQPNFRVIDSADITPDPEIAGIVAEYNAVLDEELSVELGTAKAELDSRKASVRSMETGMGNLVADAMRAAVDANIAITNGGGIRGNTQYAPGTVLTRRDILTELPFGNKTLMLELSGADVVAALENGVSQYEDTAGRFPQVSGLSFVVDTAQPAGQRISSVMVNGAQIDPAAMYTVATNDYMANGGDGYSVLKGKKLLVNVESAKLMANDVMAYVREQGEVGATGDARITVK